MSSNKDDIESNNNELESIKKDHDKLNSTNIEELRKLNE